MVDQYAHRTRLQIGTVDGIFTVDIDREGVGRLFSASLRRSPIEAIAVDPADPDVLVVGSGGPGADLYSSRDGGLDWEAPGLWPRDRHVWALAFDPHDPRFVLAGTQPPCIYRSRDRAYTWEELTCVQSVPGYASWTFPHPPYQAHIRKLAFDQNRPGVVYAAVEVGGVLRSDDRGQSWQQVGKDIDNDVHSVAVWPGDSDVVLAATGGGLYISDGGLEQWSRVSPELVGEYVVSLVVQRQAPHDVFTVGRRDGKAIIGRSDDGGSTWATFGEALPAPEFGVDALGMTPDDPAVLFYGARKPDDRERGQVFVSRDAGRIWEELPLDFSLPPVTAIEVSILPWHGRLE